MCRHTAWIWSIRKGVSIAVMSITVATVEALLMLEYRLVKGEIAIGRPGACIINTLLVCATGVLMSPAAAAVDLFDVN